MHCSLIKLLLEHTLEVSVRSCLEHHYVPQTYPGWVLIVMNRVCVANL
jgi:hypothetical protein